MKNKFILIIILIFNLFDIYACECSPLKYEEIQKYELENSEYIFIGEVIEIKNSFFKIKVIETFKGNLLSKSIISGQNTNDCQYSIHKKGKWIIYGNVENQLLKISECSVSRTLDSCRFDPPPPPYHSLNEKLTKFEKEKIDTEIKQKCIDKAQKRINEEIQNLRKLKIEKNLQATPAKLHAGFMPTSKFCVYLLGRQILLIWLCENKRNKSKQKASA